MDERMKKMIRYITGYTVFLLVSVTVLLTGCGNDADVDSAETTESSETMEYVESDEDSIKNEWVDITYDSAETKADRNDSEEVEANYDLSSTEVYELFMNGELTVEQEEEQLTVSELFLDNDIEYCFLDIDGDGSEELHIRDSEAYYVINAVKGKPQIIFSGHAYEHDMCYEPIVVDEPYGILRYQSGYCGFELVEFIEIISADGRWESDGDFYWDDENGNGIMDKADRFGIGYVYDGERIDIEQYMQYREEQIARQAENEVEWANRRLKDFATWQEAYIDFINKRQAYNDKAYSLAYVDSDDVPELYIDTYYGVTGEYIVSFYDGKVRAMNPARNPVEEGINYIEYGGLLYTWDGNNWGSRLFNIYMLEKGEFLKIEKGWSSANFDNNRIVSFDYFWEGRPVTETEFWECINDVIDTSKCVTAELYTKDEILEILAE